MRDLATDLVELLAVFAVVVAWGWARRQRKVAELFRRSGRHQDV
jgi:hypothetical protein